MADGRSTFPDARIIGYEIDAATIETAWTDSGVELRHERWTPRPTPPTDLLLADFNMSTMLSKEPLEEALIAVRPRFVVFTDVAAAKIHLNYSRYGLVGPSMDKYWSRFRLDGYELVTYRREHHSASTALWKRKTPEGDPGVVEDGRMRGRLTPSGPSPRRPSPSR